MNRWRNIIQNWLFPPTCLLCGDPGEGSRDLCRPCRETLPINDCACPCCGEALPVELAANSLCGRCQSRLPAFDRTVAVLRYEGPVRSLIRDLKFHSTFPCARLLGGLLADRVAEIREPPECIIPVPLHPRRYRERGFNQAIEIARHVAKRTGIPLELNACMRIRPTPSQSTLSAKERRKNLRGAFEVVAPPCARRVALVDDVITTGATVNELAAALKKTGIAHIDVWACARA